MEQVRSRAVRWPKTRLKGPQHQVGIVLVRRLRVEWVAEWANVAQNLCREAIGFLPEPLRKLFQVKS